MAPLPLNLPGRLRHRAARALPFALVALGLYLLVGCIYVPTFQLPKEGKDFRPAVGPVGSHKPIRPGYATKADVRRLLGDPTHVSADGRTFSYELRTTDGHWVWPICFFSSPEYAWYRLRLDFNADGELLRYAIDQRHSGGMIILGGLPPEHSPFDPRFEPRPLPQPARP